MTATPVPEGFDFTDPDVIVRGVPHEEFAALRRTSPVHWNPQPSGFGFDDGGLWLLTKHEHVRRASVDSRLFSSHAKTSVLRYHRGIGEDAMQVQKDSLLIHLDPPAHTKLRKIVQRGFTPRAIGRMEEALRERAGRIVREAAAKGGGDFVADVAMELPLQAIAELIGVAQKDRAKLFQWSNEMLGYDEPEFGMDPAVASAEILGFAMALAGERRADPRGDIVSELVQADVDGRGLTDDEFGFFVILLAVAGNETTRNAITHGMLAFHRNPEQWELYKRERPRTAADEIVRWATPVIAFQRTATADTEIGGRPIAAGERVGLYYSSANFDEEVFDDPFTFDVTRDPNPHLGFGGTGAHYCLGANLARMEIDLIFNAIADEMPGIEVTGEPERFRSAWINGVKHLPVRYAQPRCG
ncbi:cytochrome P450 [Nocardiopsis composta]|uniref:Cholest-4-en-3-one 26-monooxygenase n=1 Tax=Nocardiopsis composta TaxID=157465 RepID=A0A7W8QM32_9ACTN|nr:cytochrome P450 [Nocardiopsis composta]MBB5432769.1 cholest-4-en-3-one 26-monooxygenase [Nocardiopsis composta]